LALPTSVQPAAMRVNPYSRSACCERNRRAPSRSRRAPSAMGGPCARRPKRLTPRRPAWRELLRLELSPLCRRTGADTDHGCAKRRLHARACEVLAPTRWVPSLTQSVGAR